MVIFFNVFFRAYFIWFEVMFLNEVFHLLKSCIWGCSFVTTNKKTISNPLDRRCRRWPVLCISIASFKFYHLIQTVMTESIYFARNIPNTSKSVTCLRNIVLGHIARTSCTFPNSCQEENWTDSVHNHDKEHAAGWAISMRFVWG